MGVVEEGWLRDWVSQVYQLLSQSDISPHEIEQYILYWKRLGRSECCYSLCMVGTRPVIEEMVALQLYIREIMSKKNQ